MAEQIQVIIEKKMTSKLLKQFTIRTFIYSFLYFATLIGFFIFQPLIPNKVWCVLLVAAVNVLFMMMLSRLATMEAFDGINTTSAPKKSLKRIANVASIPLFIYTCIISFMDVLFLHSIIDTSNGYNSRNISMFATVVALNLFVWCLIVNIYEKRILKKYLTVEEE